jgi:hypothetical protein
LVSSSCCHFRETPVVTRLRAHAQYPREREMPDEDSSVPFSLFRIPPGCYRAASLAHPTLATTGEDVPAATPDVTLARRVTACARCTEPRRIH